MNFGGIDLSKVEPPLVLPKASQAGKGVSNGGHSERKTQQ